MAEYRHDAEVFSIITSRLEQEQHTFSTKSYEVKLPSGERLTSYGYYYDPESRRYRNTNKNEIKEDLKSSASRLAYSTQTPAYLRRRVWRTLKQLGEENEADYVNMTAEILLLYGDTDTQSIQNSATPEQVISISSYNFILEVFFMHIHIKLLLGARLRYDIKPKLEAALDYKLSLKYFTQQTRFYTQHLLGIQAIYNLNQDFFLGGSASYLFGSSSSSGIDLDNFSIGVNVGWNIPFF